MRNSIRKRGVFVISIKDILLFVILYPVLLLLYYFTRGIKFKIKEFFYITIIAIIVYIIIQVYT